MKTKIISILLIAIAAMACDKVDPTGVLIAHTSVDDRVKQSVVYYHDWDKTGNDISVAGSDEYSFLVGADSHTRNDLTRLVEFFDVAIANKDLFTAHLGDLAETQPEYYVAVQDLIEGYKSANKDFLFFPVVGNHDVTRNGWALFSKIFGSSTYTFDVIVNEGKPNETKDLMIFLDSANGTFGEYQIELIELGLLFNPDKYRNVFVFSHTNIFRPRTNAFSATLPREELYYMLKKFHDWKANIVFCGHIHKWDDRVYGGVQYLTLDALSNDNNPNPGEYLVRVTCKGDGNVKWERVTIK
ncbi:MAG: metallophosphoesterase [Muribaculaceae bacterium]|nr:metallophosphoesterase [Muribaculaceae bacterium]